MLAGKKYLIHDRDPLFTAEFVQTPEASGVESVKLLPPHSPTLNPHAEKFVRSIKESCLDKLVFFGDTYLRTVVQNLLEHYHAVRNHQVWSATMTSAMRTSIMRCSQLEGSGQEKGRSLRR